MPSLVSPFANIAVRKFTREDIPLKVKWINNPLNNKYLHYDIPISEESTRQWYDLHRNDTNRYDATIIVDGIAVGTIGLLSIDKRNSKAEFYIAMGEVAYKGKGVASKASRLILDYAFDELELNRVYLYTETENLAAQRLFERLGFIREGLIREDIQSRGKGVDRLVYGLLKEDYRQAGPGCVALRSSRKASSIQTPIQYIGELYGRDVYIKRDDLLPFSFGGNKARKAALFFNEIDAGGFDWVVTYGSSCSNHCRVVANCCVQRGLGCTVITPKGSCGPSFNGKIVDLCGAKRIVVPVDSVSETIERVISDLKQEGSKPYFIPGGGHGNIGTQAYVECYEEIVKYEADAGKTFDEIYMASGTGTTQAGLVCGSLIHGDNRKIVGISIARSNPRGRDVVVESVHDYLEELGVACADETIQSAVEFDDSYIGLGYADKSNDVVRLAETMFKKHGIPMDSTYTAKAFYGMCERLKHCEGCESILFVHTGGTPLFFDELRNAAIMGLGDERPNT